MASQEPWKVEGVRIRELLEDVALLVVVGEGADRPKNQEGKEVERRSRNLDPERKGGSGGDGDPTND